ncbi:MAG TPA: hypothetical protein VEG27_14355 [Usitatibacter sp.]|nr:hypothetical protein [Usitatibacter sp.]
MEEKTQLAPGQALSAEQVADVAGGAGSCSTTVTISGPGFSVGSTYNSLADALIGTYDGIVAATSHVIETVAHATK